MLKSTVTDRGQTTILAEVRKALKLKPRQRVTYEFQSGGVLIRPETKDLMDLAGSLKSKKALLSKAKARELARQARVSRYV